MGAVCAAYNEMMGEWRISARQPDGTFWQGTLYVDEDAEARFEGQFTGFLKDLQVSNGEWSAQIIYNDEDTKYSLGGTLALETDTAECEIKAKSHITPTKRNCEKWILTKFDNAGVSEDGI
eukprot:TRINITY_DN50780_c0_g1_i1.p1 TRINITY_DN50780_c0_g1~~TRINITY_DN50780_c0_g1_i1.p1  ORF type:complete len:141 (+),score=25.25 TRINITY_DN50780_c0_g1_i1:63-425(+)